MRLFLRHIVTIVLVFWIIRFATYTLVGFSTNFTSRLESLSFGHIAEWGNAYERMEEFKEWINQTDGKKKGIILGSSTAYRNIQTSSLISETGMNWFNLGSSSQTPEVGLLLLRNAAKKAPIDYVLLDLFDEVLLIEPEESVTDFIQNSTMSFEEKLDLYFLSPNPRLFDRLMYRTVKQLVPNKTIIVETPTNGTYLEFGSTYSPRPDTALKLSEFERRNQVIHSTPEINQIFQFCQDNDITLIINITPVLRATTINQLKYPLVIVNDEWNDDPDFFYDAHHFHGEGAKVYSDVLALKVNRMVRNMD